MKKSLPVSGQPFDDDSESAHTFAIQRCSLKESVTEVRSCDDVLAVEEPLEIRLVYGDPQDSTSLSITMRTPGNDFELAIGFLFSESILRSHADVDAIQFCGPATRSNGETNIVKITLAPNVPFSLESVQRHFYTSSSCGICGKASLEAVELAGLQPIEIRSSWSPDQIAGLPDQLRQQQEVFQQTGGLHASGVFDSDGQLLCLREDVGRHNALDKVLGWSLNQQALPCHGKILVVSGRASFELVQKAVAGGFEIMVAVGAPSSLAVQLARKFGLTLIGFAAAHRFNIYSCPERLTCG